MGQDWRLEVRGVRGSFPRPDVGTHSGEILPAFFSAAAGRESSWTREAGCPPWAMIFKTTPIRAAFIF